MELTLVMRKAITKAQVAKYRSGHQVGEGCDPDAVCATTGWHRDHARKSMRLTLTPRRPSVARRVARRGRPITRPHRCARAVLGGA